MSDVTNWCEYLFDIFNPFEVYQQSEEITTFPTHESTIHHIKSSRVQVLIISPKFIETATAQIREITGKNSVVGLLCGVEKEELVKLQDRIPDYVSWHLVDAKDGPRCITGTTLDIVDEMIKLADQQAPPDMNVTDDVYLSMTGNTCREKEPQSNYMQMGKGVHHGTGKCSFVAKLRIKDQTCSVNYVLENYPYFSQVHDRPRRNTLGIPPHIPHFLNLFVYYWATSTKQIHSIAPYFN